MKVPESIMWLYEKLGGKVDAHEGYKCPMCKAGAHMLSVRWSAAGKKGTGPIRVKMRIDCNKCGGFHLFTGHGDRALRMWSELHGTRELQQRMERQRMAALKGECGIGRHDSFQVGMAKLQQSCFGK